MSGLFLPPSVSNMKDRARFWHDYRYPGDIAKAIVVARRDGKEGPKQPEQCPNRDCAVCHPPKDWGRK